MIKRLGKSLLSRILEHQVKQLIKRNDFKLVAVAGSVGKTSTKLAIAKLLQMTANVRYQDGNYNDRLTVPLIFFDKQEPGIFNLPAWIRLILDNQKQLKQPYDYSYVVVELGTDAPGQLKSFSYLKPDLLVVTAIAPEHMENFQTLEAVAKEELTLISAAGQSLINIDDCGHDYLNNLEFKSYGLSRSALYRMDDLVLKGVYGVEAELILAGKKTGSVSTVFSGRQGAKIVLAAAAAAHMLGVNPGQIKAGLAKIPPVSGRMQLLNGIKNSLLIDDTYNSSPSAAIAALDVLYDTPAQQRIAILGSMNELGDFSAEAHEQVGSYCNPKYLAMVVTIGAEANNYLAEAARQAGCRVETFTDPVKAGKFVAAMLEPKAVILAKGSQNGVFAEEAIKQPLKDSDDSARLVRQSAYWLGVKQAMHTTSDR